MATLKGMPSTSGLLSALPNFIAVAASGTIYCNTDTRTSIASISNGMLFEFYVSVLLFLSAFNVAFP